MIPFLPTSSVHFDRFLSFSERLEAQAVYYLLSSFCDNLPDKENLEKEGVFQLKVEVIQFIMAGESGRQKHEGASSVASTETNQSEEVPVLSWLPLSCFSFSLVPSAHGIALSVWVSPAQLG